MTALFDLSGDDFDPGYVNLRQRRYRTEQEITDRLEAMWRIYEPYADPDYVNQFAHDPEARFWEMYIGCALLDAGKTLLRTADRPHDVGRPDICVVDGEQRIWIEAIAPDLGDSAADGIPEIVPINEGGRVQAQPIRQIHLRITSALLNKNKVLARYRNEGIISDDDICLIAIGATRFGIYAGGSGFPLALSAVFPIGNEFVRLARQTPEEIEHGFHPSYEIERERENIPRTAFLRPQFRYVSGLIWSRVSIGNMSRDVRPLSLIHNPLALSPLPLGWGVWDREFVATENEERWTVTDILA